MKRSLVVALVLVAAAAVCQAAEAGPAMNPYEGDADPVADGLIDELVLGRLNSSHVRQKMETGPKLRELLAPDPEWVEVINEALTLLAPNPIINKIVVLLTPDPKGARIIKEIYFTTLSRMPTDEELRIAEAHEKETWGDGGPRDLFWALINSPEFCYRH